MNLPIIDIAIIFLYLAIMVGVGYFFSRKNRTAARFTKAGGTIPGWAIGISIYATFLSSNTFLGVPGKAFGTNWNSFVFSISMPFAAWIASKYFVPFYRSTGEISAYTHLEKRFGLWARTYAVVCFLLTQLARMGSIFFGIALSLQALTGYPMAGIMTVVGICIILYTVLGGMEAVIWTEVVQAVIKTFGAFLILYLIIRGMPGGFHDIIRIGTANDKFSLGGFNLDLHESTFWVILFYGFFMNLNNFGMDQNYVQRYHTAVSKKEAASSIWLCVYLYVPASMLFFLIGTSLFAFYSVHPEMIAVVKHQAVMDSPALAGMQLSAADYADRVMPHFMVTNLPVGVAGLIISAILSAAMSTISSGMNASATVFTVDIYQRYVTPELSDSRKLFILRAATIVAGIAGLGAGIAMIGVKSLLDTWWEISGIFAGGMLGLFLLGLVSRRTSGHEALTATLIGIAVILWMTFSAVIPDRYAYLRNPFNKNMVIVIGTLTIFLSGLLLTSSRRKRREPLPV